MATIKATCPMCGDVDLAPRQVHVRVVEAIEDALSRRTYTFGCPLCHEDVEKSADEEGVRLLSTAGVVIERVAVPAEARESHHGAPLGYDDLLDLAMALEDTDDVLALFAEQRIA